MAKSTIVVKVSVAWWFRVYLNSLATLCVLMGLEPDQAKVRYWLNKAVRMEVVSEECQPRNRDGLG